ncbi:MAG: DUF1015 domain-containing protein [Burkholderiales bacterium]|nr:DUF1015 domain-containing protein [Burkholderiales bacterium]
MDAPRGFRLPRLCLPRQGIDLAKWAVIACDQYTSEPQYWQRVAQVVGEAPSTLHLVFPEVHLEAADAPARIARIQGAMRRYLADGLFVERAGAVLVERRVGGRARRGLMLELDLEHYDFSEASTSLIRPTEGTIVARLAPRIEVRRGAELELPHILVLIDDPGQTVIEPIAAAQAADALEPLYETELMLDGGHVRGFAVDAARGAGAAAALAALARPEVMARRYGVAEGTPPMLFAVGDGNHSLATAKSIWEQVKATVGPDHPSRFALVEVENIHDPALHFAPIHRLLFGVRVDLRAALAQAFGARFTAHEVASAEAMWAQVQAMQAGAPAAGHGAQATPTTQAVGLVEPGGRYAVIRIADPPAALAVGTLQPFIDRLVAEGGATAVDYVHGDETLMRLAQQPGCAGLHLGTVAKGELLKRVMHEGPLPRKTFSMGEAHEKRYYVEARKIR